MLTVALSEATARDDGVGGIVLAVPGGVAMRYGHLSVVDTTGRALPAWLAARGSVIEIEMDDGGAIYPLVVDPLVQQATLTANDGASSDSFGGSVSVSADGATAVIGAFGKSNATGAAHVFVRSGTTWSQQQKLTANDGAGSDRFGTSVGMSGDGTTAVIGASNKDNATGAAYVFLRSGTTWSQQQKLIATDGAGGDEFGSAVSVSGDGTTAVIGARYKNNLTGAAYVFVLSSTTWSQQQKLTANDGVTNDDFGHSVSVSGDGATAVIAAVGKSNFTGAAYVFVRRGTTWSQQQKLTATDGAGGDWFGDSAAVSGDGSTAVIGATYNNHVTGAAYVFVRSGTTWSQQQKLIANDGTYEDFSGRSVAVSRDGATAVIGADGGNSGAGAAYVFVRSGTTWTQQQKLIANDGVFNDAFGSAVAVSRDGSTAVIGAYGKNSNIGAAYVFARPTVTAVSPTSGPTTGGSQVTITGTGFVNGATVTFGNAAATNCVVTNTTTITCTTPPGSAGTVTVAVTNPDSGMGSLAGAYTYVVVNPLPVPQPVGGTGGIPTVLPPPRPTAPPATGGPPAPLPPRRP
ncbi:MAG: IPT/TIG domain-containing protein [Thermomicrobiales bacterium]